MTPLAIGLLLVSAFLHAGWNYAGKRRTPTASFFLVANVAGFLVLMPYLFLRADVIQRIPLSVFALVVLTGLFQTVYYASLAGAYRAGDLSVAYPLARSSPIIVVTVVTFLMGRGDEISVLCGMGAALVVLGCVLIPMARFSDLRLSNYFNLTCLLALGAALGTTGYSITDDEALRRLRSVDAPAVSGPERTLVYAALEALTSSLWLALVVFLRREGRQTLRAVWRNQRVSAALTGLAIYATYTIVLVSMAHVNNVSYVVAFRQVSIPIGVALGVVLLKERMPAPKIVGVGILVAGLVMVAVG